MWLSGTNQRYFRKVSVSSARNYASCCADDGERKRWLGQYKEVEWSSGYASGAESRGRGSAFQ